LVSLARLAGDQEDVTGDREAGATPSPLAYDGTAFAKEPVRHRRIYGKKGRGDMTTPERGLGRPLEPPEVQSENRQDVVPPSERSQDQERSMHDLVNAGARPLTDEERKAADCSSTSVGERVYAPASARVPKTVPDYADVVSNTDSSTPERRAAGPPSTSNSTHMGHWPQAKEPSFTRVPGPIETGETSGWTSGDTESSRNGEKPHRWMSNRSDSNLMLLGMGWLSLSICTGVGIWLWMRRQRERNKPISRLRR
jgi:hypothetical protein